MEPSLTIHITWVATSGVLNAFLCLYAFFRRKEIVSSRLLIALTALQTIYIFGFAFELASDSLDEIKRWIVVEYIGIAFAPVFGLLLALRFIDKPLSRRAAGALFVIPSITFILVATNDWHHFFYKSIYLRPGEATPMADIEVGYWYIVHGSYTFGCLFAGVVMLSMQWKKIKRAYRKQLLTLIAGNLLPMTASFLYLNGLTPSVMDPVPFVLCITSAMYLWAMVSARMLVVAPIAKQSIFESMREGVIVLDLSQRLTDYNRAMRAMLPELHHSLIGRPLDEAWQAMTGSGFPLELREEDEGREMTWLTGGKPRCYEVRTSIVRSRSGEPIGSLLTFIDITAQKQLQDELERMAFYDGLTSLFNRTQFIKHSRAMLEQAEKAGQPFSIILFDIDRFKQVNDTHGHEAGDAVLVHVARTCAAIAKQSGAEALLARYGGEEFVAALQGDAQAAARLAERLRSGLEVAPLAMPARLAAAMAEAAAAKEPGHAAEKSAANMLAPVVEALTVTASFGVAERTAARGTLEALLRDADEAMYEAKRSGKNRVRVMV